jgi:Sperm-tail PG-rich repeat
MSNIFGISANTLRQHETIGWSFSKEPRFKIIKRQEESDFINPPSTLNPRATSIGFGARWHPDNPCGKDSPPPGSYNLPSTFNKDLGPKIVKVSVLPPLNTRHLTPGPGAYDNPLTIGKQSPKFTFRGRHHSPKLSENPPPNAYHPNSTLTEFSGFKSIGFGYGNRTLFGRFNDSTPGPGTYNIESNFDKARK